MLFLLNDQLIEVPMDRPLTADPTFPLSAEQFASLTLPDIMSVAKSEYLANVEFPSTNPAMALGIAWMIASKSNANALRLTLTAPEFDPSGVTAQLAQLSIEVFGDLASKKSLDALTLGYIDATIWSQVAA